MKKIWIFMPVFVFLFATFMFVLFTGRPAFAECTYTGDSFYETVTVTSYSSDSDTVCQGNVVVDDGRTYPVEFQEYENSGSSSYSTQAINASLQTACKVLEEVNSRGIQALLSGYIYECDGINTVKAEYIVVGENSSSSTRAFEGSSRGDSVSVDYVTVDQYLVYSNQAHNHCCPSLTSSEGIFDGLVMVSTSSGSGLRPSSMFSSSYTGAVSRCNTMLEAYLDSSRISIEGEVYNPPSGTTIPADVKITSVEDFPTLNLPQGPILVP